MPNTELIEREIEAARKRLLDLTMRNRLLNYRASKAKSLRVIDELPNEVYDFLVVANKQMDFRPKAMTGITGREEASDENDDYYLTAEESSVLWSSTTGNGSASGRYTDRFLQTALDSESLQKKLFKIHSLADAFFEEQGYSVLFLALGFLKWKESPSANEFCSAPLVLIPVDLVRAKIGSPFRLQWTGDEVLGNISLIEKLKEQAIDLPEFEMPEEEDGIDQYFKKVKRALKSFPEWTIINDIVLDFFSFTKFILWRDLNKKSWPRGTGPADHILIQLLLDPETTTETVDPFIEEESDDRLPVQKVYHIVDADPSQIAVLEDTKAGLNLVVEGPPGTGKSQTITNAVAELLANGKTVLFVSEKMAALEVVKSRLEREGLGDFCLELHSRNTKKKEFIQELRRCIETPSRRHPTDPYQFQKLELIRKQLNDYVAALRVPIGDLGLTPYRLYSMKERALRHFIEVDRTMPAMMISDVKSIASESWDAALSKLKELTLQLRQVEPIDKHPWNVTDPGIILPEDVQRIGEVISGCIVIYDSLIDTLTILGDYCGLVQPRTLDDIPRALKAVGVVSSGIANDKAVLLSAEWNGVNPTATFLITRIGDYHAARVHFEKPTWSWNIAADQLGIARDYYTSCLSCWKALIEKTKTVVNRTGIREPNRPGEIEELADAADIVLQAPVVDQQVLRNPRWNGGNAHAQVFIAEVSDCQEKRAAVKDVFNEGALGADHSEHTSEFLRLSRKWCRRVSFRYYKMRKEIGRWYSSATERKALAAKPLEDLIAYYRSRDLVRSRKDAADELFGGLWNGEFSDTITLHDFEVWIVKFRAAVEGGLFTDRVHACAVDSANRDNARLEIEELRQLAVRFMKGFTDVENVLGNASVDLSGQEVQSLEVNLVDVILAMIGNWLDIRQGSKRGQSLFGRYWREENSDTSELNAFSEWVVRFRQELINGALSDRACNLIEAGAIRDDVQSYANRVAKLRDNLLSHIQLLERDLGAGLLAKIGNGECAELTTLASVLHGWRGNLELLPQWSTFMLVRRSCGTPMVEPLLRMVLAGQILSADDIIPTIEGNYAESLIRVAFTERPILAEFTGAVHETKITDFISADKAVIELNKGRVLTLLASMRHQLYQQSSRNSEAGILIDQFNRQRKLMPIRRVMAECGGLVQKIKPCFMMSPLSIAQFLDPQSVKFDVIIFDEASQVKPEDALGALMRGNQLVVMGDTRQLPPTSFFDHMVEGDGEEDAVNVSTSVTDVESILHQCKRRFPTRMLTWHYRSYHDSLIAVSNSHFYDNQLQVFPAPMNRAPGVGLQFVHCPETTYDRGKSSVNRQEARIVARAALDHIAKYPKRTVGIGTFNLKQQEAIKQEIELLSRQNPALTEYLAPSRDEHFFVKNLETIQGDERDTILISVGYGFDDAHRLSKNFGPLNQEGGERRLNVLITRARQHCAVFSNFKASDLAIDQSDSVGVRALKDFLDYAETGVMPRPTVFRADSESPFEDTVYEFLVSRGLEVHKQVGCARYWIDLAVVNATAPGTYVLGIECDGALYHSSRVARERDRLRQQVLERLGWQLFRVWSTDWYRNRTHTQRRILEAIERARLGLSPSPRTTGSSQPAMFLSDSVSGSASDSTTEVSGDDTPPALENGISDNLEFSPYRFCDSLPLPLGCQIDELAPSDLASAITAVVRVESPVHVSEVISRIRTLCGYARAGQRMQNAIRAGISHTVGRRLVRQQANFLWAVDSREIVPRKRTVSPDLEMICDSELVEAMKQILKIQYATARTDLINQVAKCLGFQRVTEGIVSRIGAVLDRSIRSRTFVLQPSGSVNLP